MWEHTELTAQESRVRNVTAAIAKSGFSEALAEQLGLEEETLRSLRQRLAAEVPAVERPAVVPDPDAVARFLERSPKYEPGRPFGRPGRVC